VSGAHCTNESAYENVCKTEVSQGLQNSYLRFTEMWKRLSAEFNFDSCYFVKNPILYEFIHFLITL
jgi:hypothetical protein